MTRHRQWDKDKRRQDTAKETRTHLMDKRASMGGITVEQAAQIQRLRRELNITTSGMPSAKGAAQYEIDKLLRMRAQQRKDGTP